jgi:hypothetical protein
VERVGVDQRKTGQHARVDPIAFGVALLGAAEIGHLLAVDQVDRNPVPRILDGDRKPGHASRLHHDLHRGGGCAVTRPREPLLQLAGSGVDSQDRGAEVRGIVRNDRFMGGLDG